MQELADVGREGRGAAEDLPHGGDVVLIHHGVLGQKHEHGGHGMDNVDLLVLEDAQELDRVKPLHARDVRAQAERDVHDARLAVDVVEREDPD